MKDPRGGMYQDTKPDISNISIIGHFWKKSIFWARLMRGRISQLGRYLKIPIRSFLAFNNFTEIYTGVLLYFQERSPLSTCFSCLFEKTLTKPHGFWKINMKSFVLRYLDLRLIANYRDDIFPMQFFGNVSFLQCCLSLQFMQIYYHFL